jgi:hypothetical protein
MWLVRVAVGGHDAAEAGNACPLFGLAQHLADGLGIRRLVFDLRPVASGEIFLARLLFGSLEPIFKI